jgi:hypothetical protein
MPANQSGQSELVFAALADLYAFRVTPGFVGRSAYVTAEAAWYEAMLVGLGAECWRVQGAAGELGVSAFMLTVLDDADAEEARGTLEAAPLDSPTFTGVPAGPTAAPGTDTTQLATTAFVRAETAALVDSSPAALDTLNELAAALGDDASFATTVTNALALKAPLASPALTGDPTAPTPAPGDNDTSIATTAFVQAALGAKVFAQTRTIAFDDTDIDVAATFALIHFPAVPAGSVLTGVSLAVAEEFNANGEGPATPGDFTIALDLPDGTTWTGDLSEDTPALVADPYSFPWVGTIGGGLTELLVEASSGNLSALIEGEVTITLYFMLPTYATIPVP